MLGTDSEKIRAAIGARRFAIARIVEHRPRTLLGDRAGQKAARVVPIVMIKDCVRVTVLVAGRECCAAILIGASPGEIPPFGLPRCTKGKSPCRAIGLLLDRHGQ